MSNTEGIIARPSIGVFPADSEINNEYREFYESLLESDEHLRNGIWPTSVAIWVVAFYMAVFLIRPWETLFPWLEAIRFERYYSIFMIVIVLASRGIRISLDSQSSSVLLFLSALVISAGFAWNPLLAWTDGQGLYVYITLVVVYYMLLSAIRTPYELVFIVACYLGVMGIYLSKCLWEFWVHGAGYRSMGVMRLKGVSEMLGHPNALAATTVLSLPLWYFLYRNQCKFTFSWPQFWKRWFRRGILLYPLLSIGSVVLTNSRGGIGALILFGGIVVMRGTSMRSRLYSVAVILLIFGVAWAKMDSASRERFKSIWDSSASTKSAKVSAEGRTAGFQAGMEIFCRFPLTGVGIGNFIAYRYYHVDSVNLAAHNLPGQALGEIGLLGSGCFVLMVFAMFINCRRTIAYANVLQDQTLDILSELASAVRVTIMLSFFCGLFCHNLYWFIWLWLAAFSVLARLFAEDRHRDVIEAGNLVSC